jgi:hypothetical protein
MNEQRAEELPKTGVMHWLKSDVTINLKGWMIAAGGLTALLLVGIALD